MLPLPSLQTVSRDRLHVVGHRDTHRDKIRDRGREGRRVLTVPQTPVTGSISGAGTCVIKAIILGRRSGLC